MRERVEGLGGEFNLTNAPGQGTLVRLRIPLGKSIYWRSASLEKQRPAALFRGRHQPMVSHDEPRASVPLQQASSVPAGRTPSAELAIAADRLILPIVASSGSLRVLENVER
jgi:hypothetical protein